MFSVSKNKLVSIAIVSFLLLSVDLAIVLAQDLGLSSGDCFLTGIVSNTRQHMTGDRLWSFSAFL